MKHSKILFTILAISLIFVLTACGGSGNGNGNGSGNSNGNNDEVITLKLAHIAPDAHSYTLGILEYVEAVERETNGRVKFEVYGNGQLGGEREIVEQVSLGVIDMTMASSSPSVGFAEYLGALELPFLFRDLDHVYATLDGEIGDEILAQLGNAGINGIAFWERGFNHFGNNKVAVRSTSDLRGLQVRSAENDVSVATYRALGADPTPIAWPEVYTSIQQGIVSGLDNGVGVLYSTGVYEALEYYSLTNMFYASAVLMINEAKFNSLPGDIQEVLVRLGKDYAHVQRQINQDMEEEQLAKMAESGIVIVENSEIDMDSFRNAVGAVYDQFEGRYGSLVERIRNVQ